MKTLSVVLCLILMSMMSRAAWAKRLAPKPVAPVVHNGVKIIALNDRGIEGRIEAQNPKTGEKLWDLVIYTVKIKPDLEEDVQWVFITEMAVRDDTLLVTNEKNEHFIVDLTTRKVEAVTKAEGKK